MPNTREKLIELLELALSSINWEWGDWPNTEELADHLIANGVTIHVRCKNCENYSSFSATGLSNGHCAFGERRTKE